MCGRRQVGTVGVVVVVERVLLGVLEVLGVPEVLEVRLLPLVR